MSKRKGSPYLADAARLTDVIAGIQALGTYKHYALSFEEWAWRISGDRRRADHWRRVFEEHPEFFRLDTNRQRAGLVWRRQYPKRYDVQAGRLLSQDEAARVRSAGQVSRLSRNALTPADIQALISTAIDLHARELERQKESHWWVPLLTGLAGAIGGFVGALLAFLGRSGATGLGGI